MREKTDLPGAREACPVCYGSGRVHDCWNPGLCAGEAGDGCPDCAFTCPECKGTGATRAAAKGSSIDMASMLLASVGLDRQTTEGDLKRGAMRIMLQRGDPVWPWDAAADDERQSGTGAVILPFRDFQD